MPCTFTPGALMHPDPWYRVLAEAPGKQQDSRAPLPVAFMVARLIKRLRTGRPHFVSGDWRHPFVLALSIERVCRISHDTFVAEAVNLATGEPLTGMYSPTCMGWYQKRLERPSNLVEATSYRVLEQITAAQCMDTFLAGRTKTIRLIRASSCGIETHLRLCGLVRKDTSICYHGVAKSGSHYFLKVDANHAVSATRLLLEPPPKRAVP